LAISGDVELNVLDGAGELCSSNSGHERPRSVLHAAAEGGVVVNSDGGQRRLWSVLHTPFRIPTTKIILNPRLDALAHTEVAH
jgi:hypothetical protein